MYKTGKPHVLLISTAYGIGGTERSVLSIALGPARLAAEGIEFRQIPYELAAR